MKRIGIDARILQLPRRGQGQYVYYLIDRLLRMDGEYEYVLFYSGLRRGECAFKSRSERRNLREAWSRFPGRILNALWSKGAGPAVERLIGPLDLFHHPVNFNFTYYTPLPSDCPAVVTFNGMADPATIWDTYDPQAIDRWFEIIARRAARIIAVSESVKEDLLRRVRYDGERIRVIPYGVGEQFRPLEDRQAVARVLARYQLDGKRYLLYVGQAEKNKNLEGLLCVFAELTRQEDFKELVLVLVGTMDAAYERIRRLADELGIGTRVVFCGYIGHDELPFIYNGALAFVLASFHEWFGIPLLEAMACGVPVVASGSRGVPEVVGEAGMLFDPYDARQFLSCLLAVLSDSGRAEEMRRRGLRQAESFSWEATAAKTLRVYEEVLDHGV